MSRCLYYDSVFGKSWYAEPYSYDNYVSETPLCHVNDANQREIQNNLDQQQQQQQQQLQQQQQQQQQQLEQQPDELQAASNRINQCTLENKSANKYDYCAKLTSYSENVVTELDCYRLLLNNEIRDQLLLPAINESGVNKFGRKWKLVNKIEFDALIGLFLMCGALRLVKWAYDDLWSMSSMCSPPLFNVIFSRIRFKQIYSCLAFCTKQRVCELQTNIVTSKNAHIHDLHNALVTNFTKALQPSSHLTVDEQLVGFHGKLSWAQTNRNKPDKHGIKIWTLCDANTAYCYNMQVYTGKQSEQSERNQSQRVVKDMLTVCNPDQNYIVGMDNFFTSIELADDLVSENIRIIGTMKSNRLGIPPIMLNVKQRQVDSIVQIYSENLTMISLVNNQRKPVLLLSSLPEHFRDVHCKCPRTIKLVNQRKRNIGRNTITLNASVSNEMRNNETVNQNANELIANSINTTILQPNAGVISITSESGVLNNENINEISNNNTSVLVNNVIIENHTAIRNYLPNDNANIAMNNDINRIENSINLISDEHQINSNSTIKNWRANRLPHTKRLHLLNCDYNHIKNGVDLLDKCTKEYTCRRRCDRYYVTLFFRYIDIVAFNAYNIKKLISCEREHSINNHSSTPQHSANNNGNNIDVNSNNNYNINNGNQNIASNVALSFHNNNAESEVIFNNLFNFNDEVDNNFVHERENNLNSNQLFVTDNEENDFEHDENSDESFSDFYDTEFRNINSGAQETRGNATLFSNRIRNRSDQHENQNHSLLNTRLMRRTTSNHLKDTQFEHELLGLRNSSLRKKFLMKLGYQLTVAYVKYRYYNIRQIPNEIRQKMREYLGLQQLSELGVCNAAIYVTNKRRRCQLCLKSKSARKSQFVCYQCEKVVCRRHSEETSRLFLCINCNASKVKHN